MMTNFNDVLDLPTVWYHGTHYFRFQGISENGIDLSKSRKRLDFGPGFYLTTNYNQAVKQAIRVMKDYNKEQDKEFRDNGILQEYTEGIVMTYELDNLFLKEQTEGHLFQEVTQDWSMFILGNRSRKAKKFGYHFHNRDIRFDYVYGPLADGMDIPRIINDLEKERIDEHTFFLKISEAFLFPDNNQLSLHTDKALSSLILKGVEVVELPEPQSNTGR